MTGRHERQVAHIESISFFLWNSPPPSHHIHFFGKHKSADICDTPGNSRLDKDLFRPSFSIQMLLL